MTAAADDAIETPAATKTTAVGDTTTGETAAAGGIAAGAAVAVGIGCSEESQYKIAHNFRVLLPLSAASVCHVGSPRKRKIKIRIICTYISFE